MIAQLPRKRRGQFRPGNEFARLGGLARAASLSKRRRRDIARRGWDAMVAKCFLGDQIAAKHYLAQLGTWNSEKVFIGTPVPVRASHPGPIQDWLAQYWTPDLFTGAHRDVIFSEEN
jgi:hypothetical protein